MINKVKRFFLSLNWKNLQKIFTNPTAKKGLWLGVVLFFVILGITLPVHSTQAVIQILPTLIIGGAILAGLQLLILISHLFLGLAGAVLGWVLSGNFITLQYTSGPVVNISWGLVRDLTNMLFIIILIFIGLATALRLREYEAKKALPLLIIIALLINFTPVICGLIVDAANIVMNFFLQAVAGGNVLGVKLFGEYKLVWDGLSILDVFNPLAHLSILFKSLTIIFFNFIAAFIFLAFAFLFVIRFIAIWVLVILSPLAFFSYILPNTRKIWNMWWNQFIQWSFIGVTGAFFLYLGLNTITILGDLQQQLGTIPTNTGWLEGELIEFFNKMLPLGIGIAFLLLGFFMGLSTGAMGGSQIIGVAKRGGAWAGKFVGGQIRGVPAINKIEAGVRRRMETVPVLKDMVGGYAAYDKGLAEKRKELGKGLESKPSEQLRDFINGPVSHIDDRIRRARAMEILAERHDLTDKDQKHIAEAKQYGVDVGKIYKTMPHLAGKTSGQTPIGTFLSPDQYKDITEKVEKISVGDFAKNVSHLAFRSATGTYSEEHLAVLEGMNLRQVTNLGQKGTMKQREALYGLAGSNLPRLQGRIMALQFSRNPSDQARGRRLEAVINHIINNPNFV